MVHGKNIPKATAITIYSSFSSRNAVIFSWMRSLRCSRVSLGVLYFLLSATQSFDLSVGLKVGSSRMAAYALVKISSMSSEPTPSAR